MSPPNVLLASERVSVFAPSVTPPVPERVVIVVPPLVSPEMSNVPLSATPLDKAMGPVPAIQAV
jgi:hypothetical protein